MTSATERLRALLDERGVEWWPMHDAEAGYREDRDTEFLVYGCKHVAHEWGCRLQVDMLTPEQAVAATLGPGTCEDVRTEDATIAFECSECGCWVAYDEYWETGIYVQGEGQQVHIHPHYCPNCGARVVE